MEKKLTGENGISIKLITEKIKSEMSKGNYQIGGKRDTKDSFKSGKLSTSDRKHLSIGLSILARIIGEGFNAQERQLLSGEQDVSKVKKEIVGYRRVLEDCMGRLLDSAIDEYVLSREMELLPDYSQISQAARDGVIVKQETRTETIDGEKKEIIYDISMTPKEVITILMDYEQQLYKLGFNRLDNYIGLGLGVAGILGVIANGNKNENNKDRRTASLITLGTTAIAGLKLLKGVLKKDDRKKQWKLQEQRYRTVHDLLENEQISSKAETSAIQSIEFLVDKEKKLETKIEDQRLAFDVILDLVVALISGIYINSKIQTKENGKIDGKSLASAIISLRATKGIAGHFINTVQGIVDSKKEEEEFERICEKVQAILEQMEEKVYPLEGAKQSFDSLEITEFTGNFYPKKDYETGKTHYSKIIKIPEFSMKRGDVVLLSGESGTGKSTFLRFLKRGDINNRKAIKLDNREMVDSLGNEYISFKPSINLGDENSVLHQITGKWSISDLTEEERKNLLTILRELKFDSPKLLEELATKNFNEFSTGQQRRLALSKVFYRIDDGSSVIIVDEPVGNVEDDLIREQLEMIKKYAENKNVMLILTTHRLDLAEDLATKRYHINKQGVLEQIPVKKKEDKGVSKER